MTPIGSIVKKSNGYHYEYYNPLPLDSYPQHFTTGKSSNLPALLEKARAYRAPEAVADYLNRRTMALRTVNGVTRTLAEV